MHNCQGHKDSEIDTGDATFIAVTGETDKGKSTVVRACKLVRDNPRGIESFIRNGQKDMSITFDDVQRIKKTGLNAYIVQGHQEPFKALNGAVPKQVEDSLNLGEENIQDQHNAIFLLDQSSGKVAQKLSKLTDLEPTTKALKIIANQKRTSNSEIAAFGKAIESVQNQLAVLEHTDAMDKELSAIERTSVGIERLQKKHTTISNVHNNAVKAQKKVADMPNTDMLQPAKQLVQDSVIIEGLQNGWDVLSKASINASATTRKIINMPDTGLLQPARQLVLDSAEIWTLNVTTTNLESCISKIRSSVLFDPSKLLRRAAKIVGMYNDEAELTSVITKYKLATSKVRDLGKKEAIAIAKKKELMGDTCPLCGGGVS